MKNNPLVSVGASSFDAGIIADTTAPTNADSQPWRPSESVWHLNVPLDKSEESSRKMLHRRYTAPRNLIGSASVVPSKYQEPAKTNGIALEKAVDEFILQLGLRYLDFSLNRCSIK